MYENREIAAEFGGAEGAKNLSTGRRRTAKELAKY